MSYYFENAAHYPSEISVSISNMLRNIWTSLYLSIVRFRAHVSSMFAEGPTIFEIYLSHFSKWRTYCNLCAEIFKWKTGCNRVQNFVHLINSVIMYLYWTYANVQKFNNVVTFCCRSGTFILILDFTSNFVFAWNRTCINVHSMDKGIKNIKN